MRMEVNKMARMNMKNGIKVENPGAFSSKKTPTSKVGDELCLLPT